MIQRIQTLFLLIAGLATGSVFLLPFGVSDKVLSGSQLFADQTCNVADNQLLGFLAALTTTILVLNIFLFKKRNRQAMLSVTGAILSIALIGLIAYTWYEDLGSILGEGTQAGIGLFMPLVTFVLSLLARRSINKDEALIRSMDRLR